MNRRLILAGAVLVLLAVVALGLRAQQAMAPVQSSSPNGRYQIIINPNVRADTFLLDTQTGRIWIPAREVDYQGEPRVWEPEVRADNQAELSAFLRTQKLKSN